MTDDEIIKALKHCGDDKAKCKGCPLRDAACVGECIPQMAKKSLALINRQKAEIERLRCNLEAVLNERADHSEAIKEFAERVCKDRVSNDPVVIAVKVELAEMTEENNG